MFPEEVAAGMRGISVSPPACPGLACPGLIYPELDDILGVMEEG